MQPDGLGVAKEFTQALILVALPILQKVVSVVELPKHSRQFLEIITVCRELVEASSLCIEVTYKVSLALEVTGTSCLPTHVLKTVNSLTQVVEAT